MNLLKIALEGFGYAAEGFENCGGGPGQDEGGKPDLVILTGCFRGWNGTEAIKEVRNTEQLKYVPIQCS
mgnify:CR=1 FL=1